MARQARKSGVGNGQPEIAVSGIDGADIGAGIIAGNEPTNSDGIIIVDPADFGDGGSDSGSASDTAGEPIRKRRGRKPGSVAGSKKTASLDINGVESILYSAHAMLAGITKAKELALDKEEANKLAEGISNVSRHYDVAATQKTIDWTNLLMICGMIYGTRWIAIRERRIAARKANPRSPANNSPIIPGVGEMQDAHLFGVN